MDVTMEMNPGFYWHVHHEVLLEWCHNYNERADYIRNCKPKMEKATRLRLFQPVKGSLPQEVIQARQAYDQAGQAYDQALLKNRLKIEELHRKECVNCPWNGKTIFPS